MFILALIFLSSFICVLNHRLSVLILIFILFNGVIYNLNSFKLSRYADVLIAKIWNGIYYIDI